MTPKTVIVVAGPTAVGKTAIAIQLAKWLDTDIISCDSRQCYKELNIGVARPSKEELAMAPHHFIASHSIADEVNAAVFENYALQKADEIFTRRNVLVMVGGTGLYVKAFCEGLDQIPAIDIAIRQDIIHQYQQQGLVWLQQQLQLLDPVFFATGEIQNPQRLMRALEVVRSTGASITSFRTGITQKRNFQTIKIALELPREQLYSRINDRVDAMMENGLMDEVTQLLPYQHLNALQTVGYKEIFAVLQQQYSLQQGIEKLKQNTRHYAKRQLTWFKKEVDCSWCAPAFTEVQKALQQIPAFKQVKL